MKLGHEHRSAKASQGQRGQGRALPCPYQISTRKTKGKRSEKAYFVTLAAMDTAHTVLGVKEDRWYVTMNATTHPTLVELLTLREEIHSHHVSGGPHTAFVDAQRLFARQVAHQEARAKAKQRAKETRKERPPQASPSAGASPRSRRYDDVEIQ